MHSPVSIQISPMIQRQLLVVILWTFLMLKGLWNFSGGLLGIQLYLLGWHYLMPWAHSLGINTHIHPYTQFTSVRQDEFAGQSQRSDGVLTDESCETSWQWNRKILQIRHFTKSSTVHIGSHDCGLSTVWWIMEPAVPHCADQKRAAEETQYNIEILSYNYLCWSVTVNY